jgi:hypothetical protein
MNAKTKDAEKGVENPAPAKGMDSASGAIMEPAIKEGVEMGHPSIDSNPREGTTAEQNARDMNDPERRKPNERDFAGEGLDPTPYGKAASVKGKK